ncbi:GNAT family N-acetyltransferase [Pseudophaeobacter sp.]|uniref:GNAT family N-acetyltransferase n=1 Tax=Pseudophaeobacter sp. TaxID=1971739 RepID=UPI003297B722
MQSLKFPLAGRTLYYLRFSAPFAMAALCLWALSVRVELPSFSDIGALLGALHLWQWLAACGATAISFWALGRYDSVAHRHLQTGLDGTDARTSGMAAIAFSQLVGFGLFTGAYARWRLVPGLTAMQAAQLTGLVGLTFMGALAVICGAAMLLFPVFAWFTPVGALLVLAAFAICILSFAVPELTLGKICLRWPSITAMAALSVWALVDVMAAATALWFLLPGTLDISWGSLFAVYAIALGAAILSSAPGGTGPLELMIFSLLPMQDSTGLLAALLAFRLVYYALPAALACALMAWPDRFRTIRAPLTDPDLLGARQACAASLPQQRQRAESAVIRQNGGHLQAFGFNQLALLDSPQISVALFDPILGTVKETLAPLQKYAQQRNVTPCFYKCSARSALAARQAGWAVMRIAAEAVITPQSFSEAGSSHRQLRRKLRHAEKAGITVRPAPLSLPISQMGELDLAWQDRHGGARGTTMGRFEPNYLAGQRVFLAWQEERIIGFVSFHIAETEWCLDLIRICPDAHDGTGHALLRTAIATAKEEAIPRLSLAAVPDHRHAARMDQGLRRFKACFAPHWEPLYMACPSWSAMALAGFELFRLIHHPGQVRPALLSDGQNTDLASPPPRNEEAEDQAWTAVASMQRVRAS